MILLLALALWSPHPSQVSGDLPLPAIDCRLDTELPLSEIWFAVEEKRELHVIPDAEGKAVLEDLPEGDLHLVPHVDGEALAPLLIEKAERGQWIQIRVRLVRRNAILVSELRVSGIEGKRARAATSVPLHTESSRSSGSSCPAPDTLVLLDGRVGAVLENDSFEVKTQDRTYVVYAGSATTIRRGRKTVSLGSVERDAHVAVEGRIAAGPSGACSVGAKSIVLW